MIHAGKDSLAHVRKNLFDSRVVRVVPVVRLLRNSLGGVQKNKGIDLTLRDSVLSYNVIFEI